MRPELKAIRDLAVVGVVAVGVYAFLAMDRPARQPQPPAASPTSVSPAAAPSFDKGYPVDQKQPAVAACPSCDIPVYVTDQTRRAVAHRKTYYFANEWCETRWRAARSETP